MLTEDVDFARMMVCSVHNYTVNQQLNFSIQRCASAYRKIIAVTISFFCGVHRVESSRVLNRKTERVGVRIRGGSKSEGSVRCSLCSTLTFRSRGYVYVKCWRPEMSHSE